GEIGVVDHALDGRRGRCGRRCLAIEHSDRVAQRASREDANAVHGGGLASVVARNEQHRDAPTSARETDGERAAHRLDLTVERELADDGEDAESVATHQTRRREDAERNRQVEGGALFADVRGREVYRDAIVREREARVADGGLDALTALAHRWVGQP